MIIPDTDPEYKPCALPPHPEPTRSPATHDATVPHAYDAVAPDGTVAPFPCDARLSTQPEQLLAPQESHPQLLAFVAKELTQ
jgi:hypothetical protein